jgi:hypothetical protein
MDLLEKASVILTPTAYNNGEALCVKPSDGSGDFDFSRATDGTRVNAQGLVETIGINLPRINYEGFSYDGSGNIIPNSGCGSWLWEPQSTNKVSQSENFSQWTAGGDTTIESGYLAPDGTNNAYKVSGTSSSLTFSGGSVTATRTIYARTVSGTGQAHLCSFNGNSNNLFTITEQWQRFEVNGANTTGASNFYAVDFRNQTTLTEIILWGAQSEDLSYATSYIPTSGSTVTRNQDVCNNGGTGAGLINSSEGVLYAEIAINPNDNGTFRLISMTDASDSVRIGFGKKDNDARWFIKILIGSLNITSQGFYIQEGFQKIAIRYKSGDSGVYINGTKVITNTSNYVNTFIIDNVSFDYNGNSSLPFFGKTKALAVFPYLTDSELQSLTTI